MKILSALSVLILLSACHSKQKIAKSEPTPMEALAAQQPAQLASLSAAREGFRKPEYNQVPDHTNNMADTSTGDALAMSVLSSSVSYAASVPDENKTSAWSSSVTSSSNTGNTEERTTAPAHHSQTDKAKIVKSATLVIQARSADSSHNTIVTQLPAYEAYSTMDKRSQNALGIEHKIQIRVAPDKFDGLINAIMRESVYTEMRDISVDDVTAAYVDMEARLKAKKEVEQRYTALLSRAQSINDIIVVENNRRYIREEIDALEGNIKLMKDQITYSTIYLTLQQPIESPPPPATAATAEPGFGARIKAALVTGWKGIEFFVLFLVNIWPLILILVPVALWAARRNWKTILATAEERA